MVSVSASPWSDSLSARECPWFGGTKGSLEWHQEEPNRLLFRVNDRPHAVYSPDPNALYLMPTAKASCRLPSGHSEAFFEAFANIYNAAYDAMAKRNAGQKADSSNGLYPNVQDGVEGMNFITQSVASSNDGGHWKSLKHPQARS
jgi:hypothetical protein